MPHSPPTAECASVTFPAGGGHPVGSLGGSGVPRLVTMPVWVVPGITE